MAVNGSIMAIMPLKARSGRRLLVITAITAKGRPEQGTYCTTSRNDPVPGDTGCVSVGTDQRAVWARFDGAGDVQSQSGHGCGQE